MIFTKKVPKKIVQTKKKVQNTDQHTMFNLS